MTVTHSRRALEQQLRDTFRSKADQLPGEPRARLDGMPMLGVVVGDAPTRRSSGLRRVVAIAATVAVLTVAAGITLSLRSDTGAPRPGVAPKVVPAAGSVEHPATGAILAPAQHPLGLRLWSMQTIPNRGAGGDFATTQLFGHLTADGAPNPGILVETDPSAQGAEIYPGWSDLTTVHGQRAPIAPSKDAGAAPTEIDWIEDGVLVRATIRGLDPLDAASILDRMRPRPAGLVDGFDPATAPADLPLLGEHARSAQSAPSTDAFFVYGTDALSAGGPIELWVRTSTTYGYPGYLRQWIAGTGSSEGSEEFDPDVGLFVARPDGTTVVVGPASVPLDRLRSVAASVALLDDGQVAAMQASLDESLGHLPLLGSRDADGVTLELRGNGAPTTLCVSTPTSTAVCAPAVSTQAYPRTSVPAWIVGSFLVDGRWYVAAASTRQPRFERPRSLNPLELPDELVLPDQSIAPLGAWRSSAAFVPDGVATVSLSADDPSSPSSSGVTLSDPRR